MTLEEYINSARRPHVWGELDCCTFAGDWCATKGWPDPMARWRGEYATQEEAHALMQRDGGLLHMFTVGCAEAGMCEVDEPRAGDIGVLAVATDDGTPWVGGICLGRRWAVLAAPVGLIRVSAIAGRCWRV